MSKVTEWLNFTCGQSQTLHVFHNINKLLFFSGQLVVASLLNRNIKSRLLLRDPEKAISLFGNQDEEKLQVEFHLMHESTMPIDYVPSNIFDFML